MSSYTISKLPRISPRKLHDMLLQVPQTESLDNTTALTAEKEDGTSPASSAKAPSIAVIDVRDSDYVGGHIRSCEHVPLGSFDYKAPELVRTLQGKDVVVFHCMLSQQRGPTAALRYLREKERMGVKDGQRVCILDGGFQAWQDVYGGDERVTEGYRKELWE